MSSTDTRAERCLDCGKSSRLHQLATVRGDCSSEGGWGRYEPTLDTGEDAPHGNIVECIGLVRGELGDDARAGDAEFELLRLLARLRDTSTQEVETTGYIVKWWVPGQRRSEVMPWVATTVEGAVRGFEDEALPDHPKALHKVYPLGSPLQIESPGQCESCDRIIHRDERWGRCPDTEALTCEDCLPDTGDE